MFEIEIFCLPVWIEEHIREKYLHLKVKKSETDNGETVLVSQEIILFKTDGIVTGIYLFY